MNKREKKTVVGIVSVCVLAVLFAAPLLIKSNLNTSNSTFMKVYTNSSSTLI